MTLPRLAKFLGRLLRKRLVPIPDRYRGAAGDQPFDHGAANALRAAGHYARNDC